MLVRRLAVPAITLFVALLFTAVTDLTGNSLLRTWARPETSGGRETGAPPVAAQASSTSDMRLTGATRMGTACPPTWSIVPNGYPAIGAMWSVAALSSTDIWAVGDYRPTSALSPDGAYLQTRIEHWNGAQWIPVPSPN